MFGNHAVDDIPVGRSAYRLGPTAEPTGVSDQIAVARAHTTEPTPATMTELTELPDAEPGDEARSATQLGVLLQAAVILINEQNQIAERLDAKSRNQLTIATTFFAGVQAGVISLVGGPLRSSGFVPYLLALACIAIVTLVGAVLTSYQTWKLRPTKTLAPSTIRDYIEFARQGRSSVGTNIVWAFANVVDARHEQNKDRAETLDRASRACLATLLVVALELILAFIAVIGP